MKISLLQIFDLSSLVLESFIGYYLYKDNKKRLSISLLKTINFYDIINDIIYILFISTSSIIFMIYMFFMSRKKFLIFVCFLTLYNSYFNLFFIFLLIPIYFFNLNLPLDSRIIENIKSRKKTLGCYTVYYIICLFCTITSLNLVLHINYRGFKRLIFIFMNFVMIFDLSKKISVNIVLLIFKSRESFCLRFLTKIKATGNVCISSFLKIFSVFYISPINEDFIVIYSLLNDISYFETVAQIRNYKNRIFLETRFLLYPYIFNILYVFYRNIKLRFYDEYSKMMYFLYIHIFFIEIYQSISYYHKLQDHEESNKI
ncbi:uncharacterized protein VNE69_01325 [Vairimorpha necatrix]|uniref:Membrane protein n=1 Tax=Vairimorpha necatrix TaxID=6039 RepID=A0AAX4J929_9MICR